MCAIYTGEISLCDAHNTTKAFAVCFLPFGGWCHYLVHLASLSGSAREKSIILQQQQQREPGAQIAVGGRAPQHVTNHAHSKSFVYSRHWITWHFQGLSIVRQTGTFWHCPLSPARRIQFVPAVVFNQQEIAISSFVASNRSSYFFAIFLCIIIFFIFHIDFIFNFVKESTANALFFSH